MGQIYVSSLGISGFWVFRVLEFNTRITRINFGYRGLLPEILIGFSEFRFFGYGFGFFGYGFRVICPAIGWPVQATFYPKKLARLVLRRFTLVFGLALIHLRLNLHSNFICDFCCGPKCACNLQISLKTKLAIL
jgi:hypothetical protein